MCNCGGRRAAMSSQLAESPRKVDGPSRGTPARSDPGPGDVMLVSRSLDAFVLRGHVSGRQYHFLPGAMIRVASGDARGLLASGRVRRAG